MDRRNADALFNFALVRLGNREMAKDLVQETFLSALQNLESFRRESSKRTWLTSILKNKIIDHYRKRKTDKSVPLFNENGTSELDIYSMRRENGCRQPGPSAGVFHDAAHAFGVEYEGQSIACFGDVSTLSFHATKVFSTIEGGAVIAKNEAVVETLKLMRNHGIKSESEVVLPGINAKMNEFQAAMGLCNLDFIDEAICRRKTLYEQYVEGLSDLPISFQKIISSKHNYSYMPVLFESEQVRDSVYSMLISNGIKPRKYFYPLTVNFDYFKKSGDDLVKKYGHY